MGGSVTGRLGAWRAVFAPQTRIIARERGATVRHVSWLRRAAPWLLVAVLGAATVASTTAFLATRHALEDTAAAFETLRGEHTALTRAAADMRAERDRLQQRLGALRAARAADRAQLNTLRAERAGLARTVDELETEIARHSERGAGLARSLRRAHEALSRAEARNAELADQVSHYETVLAERDATLAAREQEVAALTSALRDARAAAGRRTLALITERQRRRHQAQRATTLAAQLDDALAGTARHLTRWQEERDRRLALEDDMAALRDERDALRDTLAARERELAYLRAQTQRTLERVAGVAAGRAATVEEALSQTGADLDRLAERAGAGPVAAGGPLVPAPPPAEARVSAGGADWDATRAVRQDLNAVEARARVAAAYQDVAARLPLAPPVDHYYVSSGFGMRDDPVTGDRAMHEGIDLAGLRHEPVRAAAPGTVVEAGWNGAYGRYVEIDHGLGVRTRYAHLSSLAVSAGEEVAFRDHLGGLGSSGRSTATHLHYEVRIDGEALDPEAFISAGAEIARY